MDAKIRIDRKAIADFCRRNNVVELAVFGSIARGDFREDSDIDIVITFSPDARVGLLALARMETELSAMFNRKVDLVTKGGLKPLIRDEILAEAEVLYAA